MGFHRIANWRVGGESTHKPASFSYMSLFGRINIQILNCPDSLHFSGVARPTSDGQGPRSAPNRLHAHTEPCMVHVLFKKT